MVETPAGPLGHHVVRYHQSMIKLAAESLDRIPREEREIASLTLCLGDSQLRELKSELVAFRSHLLQKYQGASEQARVVQLNLQLFPLSTSTEERR